ncbi:hypothetical protein [Erythrobacter ani]|uniref:Uncharacterized protein n=1 Tax=Erythrobacter ani TaxID=2827235 RepID=A0ABS6SJB5_9SPHN|nr:hypothetical protein [Erythrobacter ani]MBV7264563.1 hypothetical protein [Erythrobacter ani]
MAEKQVSEPDPNRIEMLADLAGMFPGMFNETPIRSFFDEDQAPFARISSLDPLKAASVFAGMLLDPSLQSNCIRLEALVHIVLHQANGRQKLNPKLAAKLFAAMEESFCARLEDPAEDLFASSVRTEQGNFRILEGVWEGNTFYLQLFLNTISDMPRNSSYDELRECVFALLKLSDMAAERAGVDRNCLGEELPSETLNASQVSKLARYRGWVRFSFGELEEAGINPLALSPFIFEVRKRDELVDQSLGSSLLEKHPLVRDASHVYLILPSAVSAAIRLFIIDRMLASGMREHFAAGLGREYAKLFARTPLLGDRRDPNLKFHKIDGHIVTGATIQVDIGRYVNFVFVADSLEAIEETGLVGLNPAAVTFSDHIEEWIDFSWSTVPEDPDFKGCLQVFVSCGIGRPLAAGMPELDRDGWEYAFLSAYDFFTLSWLPDFKPLTLWRILNSKKKATGLGASLQNINGLINLVAWSRSLDSHLIPHGQMPDEFADGGPAFILIDQNSQRALRHEVRTVHDPIVAPFIDDRWIRIRKNAISKLKEDEEAPLYAQDDGSNDPILSCFIAPKRPWWAAAIAPDEVPGFIRYERFRMISMWLARAAPVLDAIGSLPAGPIYWEAAFDQRPTDLYESEGPISAVEALATISVEVDHANCTVRTRCEAKFERAFQNVENVAETALVSALVQGVLELGKSKAADANILVQAIVKSPEVRHGHAFKAKGVRDHLRGDLHGHVTYIDDYDDADLKLGLGWRVRERKAGNKIKGKQECTSFLNALVEDLKRELLRDLARFERADLIHFLVRNYEISVVDRERWRRTARAVIAIREDKAAAMQWIAEHQFRLNAVFQSTRMLVEMASCTSPLGEGERAGEVELSRLMARAGELYHLGGFSDAIRWGVMNPELRITPLGDVHANFDFVDEIFEPHSLDTVRVRTQHDIDRYAEFVTEFDDDDDTEKEPEPAFLEAWEEQYGATFDETCLLISHFEEIGIERGKAVLQMRRSELGQVESDKIEVREGAIENMLNALTLPRRTSFDELPAGFQQRDLRMWQFRRELSFLRRPIVQLDDAQDPLLLFAPGMIQEAVWYAMANLLDGTFPEDQLKPKMRSWKHKAEGRRGTRFAEKVAESCRASGWRAETEVKITKVLGRATERDFGDVDVLAWHEETGRILIIECKDVQFRKTLGEMAEQLADYRGELNSKGKPDYLKRHLDRMDILIEDRGALERYISLSVATELESHLMFRYPVPMEYSLKSMSDKVTVTNFSNIADIL